MTGGVSSSSSTSHSRLKWHHHHLIWKEWWTAYNINKTRIPLKRRTEHRVTQKSQRTSQHRTKHMKTCNLTPQTTRTPQKQLRLVDELKCSARVNSSCSSSVTRRVILVKSPVIVQEWGQNRIVITTNGAYPWSFMTLIFHKGWSNQSRDDKTFEVMS